MKVLTAEAMAAVDRRAIEEVGIPGPVLMENAAIGLADAVGSRFPDTRSVAIACGPGNNGGDGFALARHLLSRGCDVRCFAPSSGRGRSADCQLQADICRRLHLPIEETAVEGDQDLDGWFESISACDLFVDALFGTGLSRPLEGFWAGFVEALNGIAVPCLAVDLPSGLSGSSAAPIGVHLDAEVTVTFAAPKLAHVFPPACDAVGELIVVDLGFPDRLVREAEGSVYLSTAEELAGWLAPRSRSGHKGDHGHVLVVAGAYGTAGAAILAARGAVRGGAGLVTVATPQSVAPIVDAGSIESMTWSLPVDSDGRLMPGSVSIALDALDGKSVLALGPGLGNGSKAAGFVRRLVADCPLPLVLDADGLNAFGGRFGDLSHRALPTILTPHPGEMARLLGCSTSEVVDDRMAAVEKAVRTSRAVVVLKGHRTLIGVPAESGNSVEIHVNPTGNPGMGTGGTGDVLTGLIAALVAQGYEASAAAQLGVYLHGAAGDLVAGEIGSVGLTAGDLAEALPRARRRLTPSEGSDGSEGSEGSDGRSGDLS